MNDGRKDYRIVVTTQQVLDHFVAVVTIGAGREIGGHGDATEATEDAAIMLAINHAVADMRRRQKKIGG